MTRELGRLMSTLTLAHRQVWLAQPPLSEGCRNTLCTLPVILGLMFGPTDQQALERSAWVNKVRQQFSDRTPLPKYRHSSTLLPCNHCSQPLRSRAPPCSRATSRGPLHSLLFGLQGKGHPDMGLLPIYPPKPPKGHEG